MPLLNGWHVHHHLHSPTSSGHLQCGVQCMAHEEGWCCVGCVSSCAVVVPSGEAAGGLSAARVAHTLCTSASTT